MAPVRMAAPRTKRGPQNLANIGVEGRATALTMAERPKDEHGMEVMDNWYSSPAKVDSQMDKSTRKSKSNNKPSASENDSDVVHSLDLDSAALLTSGRLTREKRKSLPPPPPGRSPIKTSLGATPIRATPRSTMSPSRPQSEDKPPAKSPRRLLDFSVHDNSRSSLRSGSKSRRSDAALNDATPQLANGDSTTPSATNGIHMSPAPRRTRQDESHVAQAFDNHNSDSPPPAIGDDDDVVLQAEEDEQQHQGYNLDVEQPQEQGDIFPDVDDTVASVETSQIDHQAELAVAVHPEESSGGDETGQRNHQASKEQKRRPFSKKDPNQKKKPPSRAQKPAHPRDPSAPRVLQRKRAQTPAEADGVLQTRSGRNVYKPLAYWKGEHALFEDHTYQQNLKQIIRMEDVTPQKQAAKLRKKKRKYTVFEDPDSEEQADEEPWEISEGIVSAPVRTWDPDLSAAPPGSEFAQPLAFASARIQPRASPDNPNFFFTKTLTMPFFGAGVIEIPPGGQKGIKNSRKFQFIFFVHYGKVKVEIAGTAFTITKGGMWQVPRGNFYSMANQTEHPAKIFFAQSCELQPEPVAAPLLENLN